MDKFADKVAKGCEEQTGQWMYAGISDVREDISELADAYASLDVFVHPGEHETFCQAVHEALASGVPVVGPDAGGPRDLISHCRNGYLLPTDRFTELLPSAVDALRQRDLRVQFGSAARRSVLHRTWPAICEELLRHYEDVQGLGRRTGARAA